jgi:hypothetical protein
MFSGTDVTVYSEINIKHINTLWAKCRIVECWNIPVGFKRLNTEETKAKI